MHTSAPSSIKSSRQNISMHFLETVCALIAIYRSCIIMARYKSKLLTCLLTCNMHSSGNDVMTIAKLGYSL